MTINIAIIGGSGFIGTRLSGLLIEDNICFTIIDKVKSESYPDKWVYGDVTKPETLRQVLLNSNVVINLAAEHKDNVSPVNLYYDVNVLGAKNVCDICNELEIKKIIFTSSVAVYGFVDKETGEDGEYNPFNHYGKSKLEAESVYNEWQSKTQGNSLITIRPTVVFGERNRGNVYNLFRQIATGRFLMIGNGENQKSMAYVENVAAFIKYSISIPSGYHVFNYVDKPDFTMNELTDIICQSLGKKKNNTHVPYVIGLFGGYCFDLLSKVSGREFSVSSVRIKKFCARTQFKSNFIDYTDFTAPVALSIGIQNTVKSEFLNN
ncbi:MULTISPECIES: NAD(P)-dependent oxidoreductase [unclassified Symbiopectobacterium]|uniref:NAD-dependent epimerase/dehydratase family protein n=1 Tax=unclassified Symbiopectobacterium TaxID=2794573 RepID=UPI002227EFF0|nr:MULTISPECIES: NAD-dependent epimerase/dehydratase family protein [unclassified Symbiopectobacterium]MCW2473051.1 NAD-dependent epimerase/dehydratase family protein [Candidatus Symbiopectobacterium sp. NZEC151]MCW2481850.1 NAD-dependent epimerase/dehydratase family protein [Candidatus Symbiopectobacterium sp. NZEC135]